jgi:hypothetical protein
MSTGRVPASYAALQENLRATWPKFTVRSIGDVERCKR